MSTEDGENPPKPPPLDPSGEHAYRNRTQLEMVKVAVKRRKHAAYIDAMLEGRASDKPPTTPERPDVDKKGSAPDS